MKNEMHGFTLVELMIAIAIAGIFAALAVPSFSNFMLNNRLVNVVNGTVGGISYARNEAIFRGTPVSICAGNGSTAAPSCSGNNNWSQGYVVYMDDNMNATLDGGEQIIRVQGGYGDGLSVDGGSVSVVSFTNEGFLNSGNGNIDICTDQDDRRIQISNSGSVRLSANNPNC